MTIKVPLPPSSFWIVVDVDGWPCSLPHARRASAIRARKYIDTTAPLRVVAYDPRKGRR